MRHIMMCLMAAGLASGAAAQGDPRPSPVFQVGEELRYSVKWKFLRLGTIIMTTASDTTGTSPDLVQVLMDVRSSAGIPVVVLREQNQAVMDMARMRSVRFQATHDLNGHRQSIRHAFTPEERAVFTELVDDEAAAPVQKLLENVDEYVEGVTLFYYARDAARRGGTHTVSTLVNQELSRTEITISPRTEEIELDVVDYPVRARRLYGKAEWTGGAAGVTGAFMGWVSDDDAAVMLRAELEIFLGSIDIELEQWRRIGWQPPSPVTASR